MRIAKAKHVECTALTDPPRVRTAKMAGILGLRRQRLAQLTREGAVPSTVEGTDRRYCVEDVIAVALRHNVPVPPLRKASGDYSEAMIWAFEAYSRGICNVPAAERRGNSGSGQSKAQPDGTG